MIELKTLGTLGLKDQSGRELRPLLSQPKRFALLVYLALAGPSTFRRRDTLIALLWPESDQEHARAALRQALHFLRRELGDGVIVSRGEEEIGLATGAVRCDALVLQEARQSGTTGEALALYSGDFLEGFFVPDVAPEFEEWMAAERTRLRALAARLALTAVDEATARGQREEAVRWGRRAVELSPAMEGSVRRLMTLLDGMGERGAAIDAYDALARRLQDEHGTEPSAETQRVALGVRTRAAARPGPESGTSHVETEGASPAAAAGLATPARITSRIRKRTITWFAAAGVVAIGGYIVAFAHNGQTGAGLDGNLVAVAPFEVLDPGLVLWREGLIDYLSRSLDGAGALRGVSPTVVLRRAEARSDRSSAAQLGERTGAGLVLFGQLVGAGPDSARLRASLLDVRTGRILGEFEREDLRDRLDRAADSLTADLFRTLDPAGRGAPHLASVGTRSIPALKDFLQGEQYYRHGSYDSALAHYAMAVRRDSNFALALRRMYLTLDWHPPLEVQFQRPGWYARRAIAHNHGLAPRDSLLIRLDSLQVEPNDTTFEQYRIYVEAHEEMVRRYPNDPEGWQRLGEVRFHSGLPPLSSPGPSLTAFDNAIALDSANAPSYEHTAQLALWLHDPARARRYLQAYLVLDPNDFAAGKARLLLAILDSHAAWPEVGRLVDTLNTRQLWESIRVAALIPDSAETAVRLIRSLRARALPRTPGVPQADSLGQVQVEVRLLALRGHLGAAWKLQQSLGPAELAARDWRRSIDLALSGAVPEDTVEALIELRLQSDQGWGGPHREALAWWFARGDTSAISRLAARARSEAGDRRLGSIIPQYAAYAAQLAAGYLSLVRGDSAMAAGYLAALPDSLCIMADCFLERLNTARLLARLGQPGRAAEMLDQWVPRHLDGFLGVSATLDRARWAERLGDRDTAERSYRWVDEMWRNADPSLQGKVSEAHAGIARVRR